MSRLEPPRTPLDALPATGDDRGWAAIDTEALARRCGVTATVLAAVPQRAHRQPLECNALHGGRDTLVLSFRRGGFQGPETCADGARNDE